MKPAMKPLFAFLTVAAISASALAQDYPVRPIRFIVPFAAGGGTDLIARTVANKLTQALGQPFVVDNRTGASGVIGTSATAKAPPDGYTIMIATPSFTVNPSLMSKIPYDAIKDFAPISLIARSPHLLAVNPALPVKSVKELVALAKSQATPLTFSSGSVGGSSHLGGELFSSFAGIKMVHVPYKGTGEAALAVVSGTVSLAFLDVQTMLPLIKSGRLRGIALTSTARSSVAPELPTVAESGYPDFQSGLWYGLLAPAGTPPNIIARLNAEVVKIMQSPDMRKTLSSEGAEAVGSTPEAFAEVIKTEIPRWSKLVKEVGIAPTN